MEPTANANSPQLNTSIGEPSATSLPPSHPEISPRHNIHCSSTTPTRDDTMRASAADQPSDLPSAENPFPRPTSPAMPSELIIKYAKKLQERLTLPRDTDKRFAPSGTAHEIFNDDRFKKLLKALLEVQKTSNRSTVQQEDRLQKLIAEVKGQKGGEGLFNILATLVYIEYNDILGFLESRITNANPTEILDDSNLPLSWETAGSLFGQLFGPKFFHNQTIFTPFTFIQGQENKCHSAEPIMRLPIVERKEISGGAYSDVYHATIEKGGWKGLDGTTNRERKHVAQKVFKSDLEEEKKPAFVTEHDIHQQISRDNTSHKNLVPCLGSLEHLGEYSLFFELADCTLEDVLNCDSSQPPPAEIFRRAAGLCEGLDHLHHGLSHNGHRIIGYHSDFKPRNILIYGDVWKVADFSLSKLKYPQPEGADSAQATSNYCGDGTFIAPEAYLKKGINSVSDLWSLAAVLIEVLAFAIGGSASVTDFRTNRRTVEKHDMFFVERGGNAFVNEKVTQWCQHLRRAAAEKNRTLGEVVNNTLEVLERKVLVVDVKVRKQTRAKDISVLLYNMSDKLKEDVAAQTPAIPLPHDHERGRFKKLTSLNFWIPASSSELQNYSKGLDDDGSTFSIALNGAYWFRLSADRKRLEAYPLTGCKSSKTSSDVRKSREYPQSIISHPSKLPIRQYHVSVTHLIVFPQCEHFECSIYELRSGKRLLDISLLYMNALEEAAISTDGTMFAFMIRKQDTPTQCTLYRCTINQLINLSLEGSEPHDPSRGRNTLDPPGQVLIDKVVSHDNYELCFSTHDMIILTNLLKKDGACVNSWSKSGMDHKEWKPLRRVDYCPVEDTLKCLVVRHKKPLRVAVTSSGTLIREQGDDRASVLPTGLSIEYIFITASDRNVILLARETQNDRSFLSVWKIKMNNIGPGQKPTNMGRLGLNDNETAIGVAFLRSGLLRKTRIRAITTSGRVVESRFL